MKLLILLTSVFLASCGVEKLTETDYALQKEAKESFEAIPDSYIDKNKYKDLISLGEKLYFEKKLSANNTISCNSCHQLDNFGVDNEPTSPGHDGRRGDRNSPTVYNSAYNLAQFWDGRAKDLAAQALGPILNPIEHGLSSKKEAMKKLKTPEYLAMFKKAFPKHKWPFTYRNVGKAIEAFEKTLLTPSRFDEFLNGDIRALTKTQRRGLKKFMETGCVNCHNGPGIGGGSYQKLGDENSYKTEDKGRYNVTKDKDDMHHFKVPLLRNITKTAPYFHDGSIKTLDEAIQLMGWHQLNVKLSTDDIEDIKEFLVSLEGRPKYMYQSASK